MLGHIRVYIVKMFTSESSVAPSPLAPKERTLKVSESEEGGDGATRGGP